MEKFQYGQQVIFQEESTLQEFKTSKSHVKYVRTKYHGDVLLMDNEVQFSTLDEERYHDLLVSPDITYGPSVLILGGGDGLALRNVYKYSPIVERAVVVDWDQEFVEKFAMNYPRNEGSLKDLRTKLVYMDAVEFLRNVAEQFDTIIIDLPDPDDPAMQTLYFTILQSIPSVMHDCTEVMCHVGPVSLCKEHPNWTFIKKFIQECNGYVVDFHYRYIPTFSHEWGVVLLNAFRYVPDKHELPDIRRIYHEITCETCETCENDDQH